MWRGGAFNNSQANARCAYRNRNNPNNRNDNLGWRVVAALHAFRKVCQQCVSFTDERRGPHERQRG